MTEKKADKYAGMTPEEKKAAKKADLAEFRKKRKEMKKRAHSTVRHHYAFLFLVCLILVIVGGMYQGSLQFMNSGTDETKATGSGVVSKSKATDVFDDIVNNRIERGDKNAEKAIKRYRARTKDSQILGRRNGVLAQVVNGATSGKFYVQIVSAMRHVFRSDRIASGLFVLLALLVSFLLWSIIQVPLEAVGMRLFLEAGHYERVPAHHMLWFLSVHKWLDVVKTMVLKSILMILWTLTIIGGVIMHYAYAQVAFIVAENPGISPFKAIKLSTDMMRGHKWEMFKLEMTYFGWSMLSFITFGLAGLLYVNQYTTAIRAEYYEYLREIAKKEKLETSEQLDDKYLFEHAPEELLWKKYIDIEVERKYVKENQIELPPVQKFFVKNFGLWLGKSEDKKKYQEIEGRSFQIRREKDILDGKAYPGRLNPHYDAKHKELAGDVSFLRCYTVWSVILMFFAFSMAGWIWEVSLHLVNEGTFVNRGMLQGPWLPIYGYGGTLILVLLTRLRKNPLAEFIAAMIVAGIVEYFTSYALEMSKGMLWWDYSGYFLNLHGRICAEGLLVFGVAGLIVVYALAPFLDNLIEKIPNKAVISLCLVLLAVFAADQVYSNKHPNVGEGITHEVKDKKKAELTLGSRSGYGTGVPGGTVSRSI